jgi:acetyl esterase/lipase
MESFMASIPPIPQVTHSLATPLTQPQANTSSTDIPTAQQSQANRTDTCAQPILKQPPPPSRGILETFVAKCVLPALYTSQSEKAKEPSETLSWIIENRFATTPTTSTPTTPTTTVKITEAFEYTPKGQAVTKRYRTTSCSYEAFKFNKNSSDIETVIPIPMSISFCKFEELIKKYKQENKNIAFVRIPQGLTSNKQLNNETTTALTEHFNKTQRENFKIEAFINEPLPATSPLITATNTLVQPPFGAVREVNVSSKNGALLNGVEIRPNGLNQELPENQKWIVYFNQNAATWEQNVEFLAQTAKDVGANVISCNYRGVAKSSGFPTKDQDLIDDGQAVVDYLLKQGVPAENILICGTSLGGAVATHVAAARVQAGQNVSLISDRSFSSLSRVVWKIGGIVDYILPILALLARAIAIAIMRSHDWKLDSGEKLQSLLLKTKKVTLLHHAQDRIIPEGAQAVDALSAQQKKDKTITLSEKEDNRNFFSRLFSKSVDAHNRRLYANEHDNFVNKAKEFLNIPPPNRVKT